MVEDHVYEASPGKIDVRQDAFAEDAAAEFPAVQLLKGDDEPVEEAALELVLVRGSSTRF